MGITSDISAIKKFIGVYELQLLSVANIIRYLLIIITHIEMQISRFLFNESNRWKNELVYYSQD